jgi:hypothetical protein
MTGDNFHLTQLFGNFFSVVGIAKKYINLDIQRANSQQTNKNLTGIKKWPESR